MIWWIDVYEECLVNNHLARVKGSSRWVYRGDLYVLDVEPSLSVRVHVLDLARDGDGTSILGLFEGDHSLDGGVSLEDSDSL
jgi:hypothetical protein